MNEKKEVFGAQIAARLACLNLIAAHAKLIDEGEAILTFCNRKEDSGALSSSHPDQLPLAAPVGAPRFLSEAVVDVLQFQIVNETS